MTIEKKLLGTSPSGGATDVAKVFSVDVWDNEGSSATITSGLDSTDSDVMIWAKQRDGTGDHYLADTVRGITKYIKPNSYSAESTSSGVFASTSSTGYTTGDVLGGSTQSYVGWQFKTQKKFFDVVTYTGNGVAGRTVSHNLGSVPGMMIVRNLAQGYSWQVYHRSMANTDRIELDNGGAKSTGATTYWNSTTPTSSVFTLGTQNQVNEDGDSFVAYLFADNSSEDAEDQMIKCGSYTGNNAVIGPVVNLGWEPQFVLIKSTQGSDAWVMFDSMRGLPEGTGNASSKRILSPNSISGEGGTNSGISVDPTGFHVTGVGGQTNDNNYQYIWMAIRADLMVEPKAATDVFAVTTRNVANDSKAPEFRSTFPVDMALKKWNTSDPTQIVSRLTQGNYLTTNSSNTEQVLSSTQFGYNNGWSSNAAGANTDLTSWMWKRAKGFFDVVAYTGTGANRTLPHSLSVVPEMMWVRSRKTTEQWMVYHSSMTLSVGTSPPHRIVSYLSLTNRPATNTAWDNQAPTDSVFSIGNDNPVNQSTKPYIAYLFATLDGVSKCGGYTGNGSSQTISCGFSAGSRFVLIHRTDDPDDDGASGSWYVWDSVRGIVAGNDPHFSLHTNNGDITNDDSVDPHNSGFIVNQVSATDINVSSGKYIFYAIA